MKKLIRAARNGDSTRTRAQSKATRRPAKAAASNVTLAKAEGFLKNPQPAGYHRRSSPALVSALKRFLTPQSFAALSELHQHYGVAIERQLAGALGAWLAFINRHRRQHDGYTVEFIASTVNEYACVLDPDQMDYAAGCGRRKFVSDGERHLYQTLLGSIRSWPIKDGAVLADFGYMLSHHPGFSEESKALIDAGTSIDALGHSAAVASPQ